MSNYWPKDCPTCGTQPVRQNDGERTWLECDSCELAGSASNLQSDDYAFTNSGLSWNNAIRQTTEVCASWIQ